MSDFTSQAAESSGSDDIRTSLRSSRVQKVYIMEKNREDGSGKKNGVFVLKGIPMFIADRRPYLQFQTTSRKSQKKEKHISLKGFRWVHIITEAQSFLQ